MRRDLKICEGCGVEHTNMEIKRAMTFANEWLAVLDAALTVNKYGMRDMLEEGMENLLPGGIEENKFFVKIFDKLWVKLEEDEYFIKRIANSLSHAVHHNGLKDEKK